LAKGSSSSKKPGGGEVREDAKEATSADCVEGEAVRWLGREELDRVRIRVEERADSDGVSESEGIGYNRKGGMSIDCKEVRFFGILFFCWVYDRWCCSESRQGVLASKSGINASYRGGDAGGEDTTDEREN
jgi:hypothetical protein